MPLETPIQMARKALAGHNRAQLIAVIRDPVRQGAERTAAEQMLDEMNQVNHGILVGKLDELRRLAWYADPYFWITLIGATAAVVAAYFGWLALQPARMPLPVEAKSQPLPPSPQPQKVPPAQMP